MANNYELGFTFIAFKRYKEQPVFVRPENINHITPSVNGFNLRLKGASDPIIIYNTQEELTELLNEYSYKIITPTRKTSKKRNKTL